MSAKLDQAVEAYSTYVDTSETRPFLSAEGYSIGFSRSLRGRLGLDLEADPTSFTRKQAKALTAAENDLATYLLDSITAGLTRADIASGIQAAMAGAKTSGEAVLAELDPDSL